MHRRRKLKQPLIQEVKALAVHKLMAKHKTERFVIGIVRNINGVKQHTRYKRRHIAHKHAELYFSAYPEFTAKLLKESAL